MRHGIYSVFRLQPGEDGQVARHRAGRLLVNDRGVFHLEDYHGRLLRAAIPAGAPSHEAAQGLARLRSSPYVEVSHWDDWLGDKQPAQVKEEQLQPFTPDQTPTAPGRPPSVWEYHRVGMDRPHILEAQGPEVTLDGQRLSNEEIQTIMRNVQGRAATLRYRTPPAPAAPSQEQPQQPMAKAEDGMPQGNSDTLLKDIMVPKLGNMLALAKRKEKEGDICVSLDINDFWQVNEMGWRAGDEAIIAYGELVASAAGGQSFRVGGDSFVVYKPSWDEAWSFVRELLEKEKDLPSPGGTFKLTVSVGIGQGLANSQRALQIAKTEKYRGDSPDQPVDSVYTMKDSA